MDEPRHSAFHVARPGPNEAAFSRTPASREGTGDERAAEPALEAALAKIRELESRLAALSVDREEARARLAALEASTFWTMTSPLRRAVARFPALRSAGRSLVRASWWPTAGQPGRLPQRAGLSTGPRGGAAPGLASPAPSEPAGIEADAVSPGEPAPLAVPFGYRCDAPAVARRVAVVLHIFYAELAAEIAAYLDHLPFRADVFISTDSAEKKQAIEAAFSRWKNGGLEIRLTANRGRDIAPKLVAFRDVYHDHDWVLFAHSKRSTHEPMLEPWREFLLRNLVGSRALVCSVFEAFSRDPGLGMIAAEHFAPIRPWLGLTGNLAPARELASRMGLPLPAESVPDFPSGSMFWARSAALRPLLDLHLTLADFEEERGQLDGTLAHAIERLFFVSCERAGYRWIKIADPALFTQTGNIVSVASPAELERFLAGRSKGPRPPDRRAART